MSSGLLSGGLMSAHRLSRISLHHPYPTRDPIHHERAAFLRQTVAMPKGHGGHAKRPRCLVYLVFPNSQLRRNAIPRHVQLTAVMFFRCQLAAHSCCLVTEALVQVVSMSVDRCQPCAMFTAMYTALGLG